MGNLSAFAVLLFLFTGCNKEATVQCPVFDGQRAFAEVERLVEISPRDAGTSGGRKAAEQIVARLSSFGIPAEISTFTDRTPEGEKTFHNVVGQIRGQTDRWIMLGSHFDTMPGIENFQGANDSGSSTGILIELARILAGKEPQKGILFAFFDGEEGIANYCPGDGLHGSRHLANRMRKSGELDKVDALILMDMVGDKDLNLTVPFNSSRELVKALLKAAHVTGHRDQITLARNLNITDDHQPFLDMNVPSIDLIDFHFGSAPGKNDYWHTSNDSLENISVESLQACGDIVLHMLYQLESAK